MPELCEKLNRKPTENGNSKNLKKVSPITTALIHSFVAMPDASQKFCCSQQRDDIKYKLW